MASVQSGEQGKNAIRFLVLQNGTIPENFVKLEIRSGQKDLDEASPQAVRKAAPFKHLPEKFSQPFIDLRVTFYYNSLQEFSLSGCG
jgi:TonB family protein